MLKIDFRPGEDTSEYLWDSDTQIETSWRVLILEKDEIVQENSSDYKGNRIL